MTNTKTTALSGPAALDRLETLYSQSVSNLRTAVGAFLRTGERADPAARAAGLFSYPELRVSWFGERPDNLQQRAFARLSRPGVYATTITRPDLYRPYLLEQLSLLEADYGATFEVRPSEQEIPFPYVMDGSDVALDRSQTAAVARHFPTTDLAHIGDEISDGLFDLSKDFPLAQFDGLRTDFSLARLRHYTGTPVEDVQSYILFTNYNRYVDEFVRWACAQLTDPNSIYDRLVCAGGIEITKDTPSPETAVMDAAWKKHQMPAYHLTAPGHRGITLVNIGVGPSNAKTICDHLAVTRPHAWMMIGHCGGLRPSQSIGDYVLAHAYLRDDHVLDAVLPPDIPIPSIAEVQRALYDAAKIVSGAPGEEVKRRLRTGT
ncbi:MAG TPA: AMP nucleosidase, partial [Brevundimonas sp.]|nr:AMP nucleosidase [Brevundimonas sp.]